jgi:hypothetical protein
MHVVPMPPSYPELAQRQQEVAQHTAEFVRRTASEHPQVAGSVLRLLAADHKNSSIFRLLPFPVLGALTGDPAAALPVCILSRLWWTGADIFDDLNDGHFDVARVGMSPSEATIASIACGTLLPLRLVQEQTVPAPLRSAWLEDLTRSNLDAADGQLADVAAAVDPESPAAVLRSYAGKSGAACARDFAMTARLAGLDAVAVDRWEEFGRDFGVLRQLANDRKSLRRHVHDDEDLANGTSTLLLAQALAAGPEHERRELRRLSDAARSDLDTRVAVRDRLTRADVGERYDAQVTGIGDRLAAALVDLAAPSPYRDAVAWLVGVSVESSLLGARPRG